MEDRKIVLRMLDKHSEELGIKIEDSVLINTTLYATVNGIKDASLNDVELLSIARYLLKHLPGVEIKVTDMVPF